MSKDSFKSAFPEANAPYFSLLIENMGEGVAIYDPIDDGNDFVFVDLNSAAEKFTLTAKEELLGRKVTEAFPGIIEMGLLEVFRKVLITGNTQDHTLSLYKDQHIQKWVENRIVRLPDNRIMAIFNDYTSEKSAIDNLKESEERYRTIFNTSRDGIFIYNKEKKLMFVNPAACKMHKRSEDEMLSLDPKEFIHPSTHYIFEDFIEKISNGESLYQGEALGMTRDGKTFNVEVVGCPIYLNEQRHFFSMVKDITDYNRTVEALKKSEQKLQSILRTAPIGITMVKDRAFIYINEQFCKLLESDRGRLENQSTELFFKDREEYERFGDTAYLELDTSDFSSVQAQAKTASGKVLDVIINTTPIQPGDLSMGVTSTVIDITEKLRIEKELQMHQEHLEVLVETRTEELQRTMKLMVGREVRMADLKEKICKLQKQLIAAGIEPAVHDS